MPRLGSTNISFPVSPGVTTQTPLDLHGVVVVSQANLVLESEVESTIVGGKLLVEGALIKSGRGRISLRPVVAQGTYNDFPDGYNI